MSKHSLIVGEYAVIEMRLNDYCLFSSTPSVIYQGTVLKREEYDPPRSFRLSGDRAMPVRVIAASNVISVNGEPFEQAPAPVKLKPTVLKIAGSKPGTSYDVEVFEDGRITCPCKGFGFKHRCSHVDAAREILAKDQA